MLLVVHIVAYLLPASIFFQIETTIFNLSLPVTYVSGIYASIIIHEERDKFAEHEIFLIFGMTKMNNNNNNNNNTTTKWIACVYIYFRLLWKQLKNLKIWYVSLLQKGYLHLHCDVLDVDKKSRFFKQIFFCNTCSCNAHGSLARGGSATTTVVANAVFFLIT